MRRSSKVAIAVTAVFAVFAAALLTFVDDGFGFGDLPFGRGGPVRFLVVGDTGTGDEEQYHVGATMGRVCADRGCDFVLMTGDIIYPDGADGAEDPKWWTHFELPYRNLTIPFYGIAGNHDYGNEEDAEDLDWDRPGGLLQYASTENGSGAVWTMPQRYYTMEHEGALFIGVDTTPPALMENGTIPTAAAEAQGAWLDQVLAQEHEGWRFAWGHHPYASNGQHGNETTFRAFFEQHVCDRVDVYFAGHDHDLQWLAPTPSCGRTQFIVSGAGAEPRELEDPERNEAWYQVGDTLGFVWVEVHGRELTAVFFDGNGTQLYRRVVTLSG